MAGILLLLMWASGVLAGDLQELDAEVARLAPGDPTAYQIYNRRARLLMDLGKFEEAEADASLSIRSTPNFLGQLRLSMAHLYQGDDSAALEAGRAAVRQAQGGKAELAQAYKVCGCARWRMGDPGAVEDLRAAEELDPGLRGMAEEWKEDRLISCLPVKDARRVYSLTDEARRLLDSGADGRESAVEKITEALGLVGDGVEAHHLYNFRARGYNLLDQPMKAYSDAAASIRLKPQANPAACLEISIAGLKSAKEKADYEAALVNSKSGIEQAKDGGPEILARLYRVSGCAKLGLGRTQEARADFELMAKTDPRMKTGLEEFDKGSAPCEGPDEEWGLDPRALRWALGSMLVLALAAAAWFGAAKRRGVESREEVGIQVRTAVVEKAPRLAGKYELLHVIGRGGMGAVYEAMDHSLGRAVAIKKMAPELIRLGSKGREYFLKEAHNVAALRHSAIVEIYAVVEDGEDVYLVFELVKGKTVEQILAQQKRFALPRALEILRPVCQALQYAHGRQMVHRDLKPANIMVTDDGRIKLMDFGIARTLGDPAAVPAGAPAPEGLFIKTHVLVGTPVYMSPEALRGIIRQEGDLYAMGVVLYEMLTGRRPFSDSGDLERKLAPNLRPVSAMVPGVPSQVDELIVQALQPVLDRRVRTAAEFLARLEAAANGSQSMERRS